ncbi:Sn1-specific diacylglycerol lipase beta [Quillaja saponaria]|uniref:Sn1-specific diacylglycerol lipase beta n=1 Tax=Quillaja saponaria TaxID=32244 RepID=A0AAD7LFX5_QUISA|nr:Sn1-specific diacylglycerol lipase beta [Quillaja saponaria]
MWVTRLENVRLITIILGISNVLVVVLGGVLILQAYPECDGRYILPFVAVSFAACVRIGVMIQSGIAQEATARIVLETPSDSTTVVDAVIRQERRIRYKKWLLWTRFTVAITLLQFVCATYLILNMAHYVSAGRTSCNCVSGVVSNSSRWKHKLLVLFMIMMCFVAVIQCFAGSDVLRWRSFYETLDHAWKAHYREVFDNGIREALCCMGRVKYLGVSEEDEVYSVARLLGDLVAYRASGTGHMELLAGLALLQSHRKSPKSLDESMEAPEAHMQEAAALQKFSEAAYTGPLLDIGRNPFIFPCAWLYRQGALSPWARNRRPVLEGDNWWRGHAAAFLKYVDLSPEDLRQGRVNQAKCQASYFVVVLHHLQSIVIAIRGTETPEDLITDGLCRECILSAEDLDGLINCSHIHPYMSQIVKSSFPHHGHAGIVKAARELYMKIEGSSGEYESNSCGLLSSLLGGGCECYGYNVRIVGHSLGGAIAALLGLRLYRRYPNLHVYAYGPLPCLDSVVANACSEFVTSIVHDNEFSSRLSIGSIMRLRAAAIASLSEHKKCDTAMIFRLARRFLYVSKYERSKTEIKEPASDIYLGAVTGSKEQEDQEASLWTETGREDDVEIEHGEFTNAFATDVNSHDDPITQFMETVPSSENGSTGDPPEMYLPGLVVHMVPQQRSSQSPFWTAWRVQGKEQIYKAYIANRECFRDIVVSQSMFLDHLPWRCHYALQKVLEARSAQGSCMN